MKPGFSSWLSSNKGFTGAAAKDVACRLRRASSFCDFDWEASADSNVFSLGRSENFQSLTVSVKSQLRRSVKLYGEFLKS
jgi:DNA (cytosine-5)-methyltransferase 1